MTYLVDTNVLSEVRKRRPDPGVRRWYSATVSSELYLSVLVVGEIRQGIERLRRRDDRAAESLESWLGTLLARFGDHVVPVSAEVADRWGRLNVPDPLPAVDGLMAATALVHGWTLVTRNERDVAESGVPLLNPFDAVR